MCTVYLQIRKQAIKDLPALCKDNKEHIARIADILAQLLQAQDPSELAVVHNSVMSLMKTDPKGTEIYDSYTFRSVRISWPGCSFYNSVTSRYDKRIF